MTRHGLALMVEFALLWPLALLVLQAATGKVIVGGRLVDLRTRPGRFGLWLVFDAVMLVLAWRVLEWVGRGWFWP